MKDQRGSYRVRLLNYMKGLLQQALLSLSRLLLNLYHKLRTEAGQEPSDLEVLTPINNASNIEF